MLLEQSLNKHSQELYEKLIAAGVTIQLEIDKDAPTWYVRPVPSYKIGAPSNIPNEAAMAHELLHIQLNLKGFSNALEIYKLYNEENSVFTPDFINELNNSLAHFKMLDDFLAMDFKVDDFLQDTPKKYFLENIIYATTRMVLAHKTETANICEQTREIIKLCASAKLFEKYHIKDPQTKNGLHPNLILDPLKEINKELVEGLETLFVDWDDADTTDNLQFYFRLNKHLNDMNIPHANEC